MERLLRVQLSDPELAQADYNGTGVTNLVKYLANLWPLETTPPAPLLSAKPKAAPAVAPKTAAVTAPAFSFDGSFSIPSSLKLKNGSGGYKNGAFQWSYVDGLVGKWQAYAGSKIEAWKVKDEGLDGKKLDDKLVIELDATGKADYGIKQKLENITPGTYMLTWKDLGRSSGAAGDNLYGVLVGDSKLSLNAPAQSKSVTARYLPSEPLAKNKWISKAWAFNVTQKNIDDAKNAGGLWLAFVPRATINSYGALIGDVRLTPLELAPDPLPVNADFNRGAVAHVSRDGTGAIPDYRAMTLIAEMDSIDGRFKKGDRVTKDLHQGWFGLNRNKLPADFFDGASVTVCKKVKTDIETNKPELGQIRLYATWGEKNEKCIQPYKIGGISYVPGGASAPVNLVPLIYGLNSEVPADAQLWIEGVIPGKITLEWRLQKGSTDVKFEQTFNIRNDWTREQWRAVVRDELYVDSYTSSSGAAINGVPSEGLDINDYLASGGFTTNRPYIYSVFEYYAKLHAQNLDDLFLWTGMAKAAGGPIYAGLSDAASAEALHLFSGTSQAIQGILFTGNIAVFEDIAYQFIAYRISGIGAIKYLHEQGELKDELFVAWQQIDRGYRNHTFADVMEGNKKLLNFEQKVILDKAYVDLSALSGGYIAKLFSVLAENPVRGGKGFNEVVPGGNLANFDDRWQWIADPKDGMWKLWTQDKNRTQRLTYANTRLSTVARLYSWLALQ